ncbi:MAG: sensor histidine kinase [Actinobacteria bacterium]|nr:sensor histidine kinase [Actinomycetota bacterium]
MPDPAAHRRFLETIVEAQEQERRRIALEIHDDAVQVMAASLMRLEVLASRTADGGCRATAREVAGDVRRAIERLRRLMTQLRPPELGTVDAPTALRKLLDRVCSEHEIEYAFRARISEDPAPATTSTLYRIAQEALTNAWKHSRATRVEVELHDREEGIALSIQDDGVGCPIEVLDLESAGHFGIAGMRERADALGGWCWIDGAPGQGTTVSCWIPREPDTLVIDVLEADPAYGG